MLVGIGDYPFMSYGYTLVSGITKAFGMCPHLGEFLDKRIINSSHLTGGSLERRALNSDVKNELVQNKKTLTYGSMIAMPW